MRLNPDCIRDILLTLEDVTKPNSLIFSTNLYNDERLSKYSVDEFTYHLQQLIWSGYIKVPNKYKSLDNEFIVNDLSPEGHAFISNIRENTNWNKVKKISKKVGSETLSSLRTIAENVIASAIKNSMGLP